MDAIEFEHTSYELGGKRIVGPIDLKVEPSETLVLLGHSGSGKTTTLRLVNALQTPTSGAVLVAGRRTSEVDPVELRRGIGYVIQETGLMPHMTVLANAGLVLRITGAPKRDTDSAAAEMLSLVGLDPAEYGSRYPHQLSGGQKQRVGVARALAANPPLLLCDEPFGATDPATRSALQTEFADLTGRLGKTVVFVTHDVREALILADRIAVLEDGTIRFLGTTAEFETTDNPAVAPLRNQ